jgi:hypothetical protein
LAKEVWHQYELWFLPFAVILVVLAHTLNFRLCRSRPPKRGVIPLFKSQESNSGGPGGGISRF